MFCLTYLVTLGLISAFPASASEWGFKDINLALTKTIKPASNILIAVIDTGVDRNHPALKDSFWRNQGEIPDNGIDDDRNGYIDDVYGWDFPRGHGRPSDRHGHGTHIAGLIHKIAPDAKIMVLKYYDPELHSVDTVRFTVEAFKYAIKMKAKIINYSGGGTTYSAEEHMALDLARQQGILVVAAAGNEGQNSDLKPYYPADYNLSNILSVTAHNPHREILVTSNYGIRSVDLSAPGENIRSALPGGKYGEMTGTSQATAITSGVAALSWSEHGEIKTPEELIRHLVNTGAAESKQSGKTVGGRRLDAFRALALHDSLIEPQPASAKKMNREPSSPRTLHQLAEQLSQTLSRPEVKTTSMMP